MTGPTVQTPNVACLRPPAPAAALSRGHVAIQDVEIIFRNGRNETQALAPVTLDLEPGTFTALIGPSGCGKSTLMNAIAGFVFPSAGRIDVNGVPVKGPDPEVGVIFQQYALFPWFTALGNVKFALKRFGLARDELERRAREALAETGLAGQEMKYPGQLSGGMKQRVAIARTFSGAPKVLLMDEPFGALDAQTRISMHTLLMRVWQAHRATVLFITHDVDEALVLADRVYVMSRAPGRIIKTFDITHTRPRSAADFDMEQMRMRSDIHRLLRPPDE
ncbi:MAG: ABC transporter ATP-binding protein [Alphaproteobacteria bacterium]|nr:ABC transporter ATP-binding protein [Alphaproteobacteria bacterium]